MNEIELAFRRLAELERAEKERDALLEACKEADALLSEPGETRYTNATRARGKLRAAIARVEEVDRG